MLPTFIQKVFTYLLLIGDGKLGRAAFQVQTWGRYFEPLSRILSCVCVQRKHLKHEEEDVRQAKASFGILEKPGQPPVRCQALHREHVLDNGTLV